MRFSITDSDLIQRVRAGDSEVYAELVARHYPKILCLCLSMLGNRTAADDATQETFLKAYKSLNTFQETSLFSTWLHRIASNRCLDLLRRKTREKTDSLEALIATQGDGIRSLIRSLESEESSWESADLIQRVLGQLPDDYRLILTLRETQGLSYQEIAETLSCSLDAVKSRLRRARLECAEILRHLSAVGCV